MKHCKMFGFFCILKTQYMSPWIRVISALSGSISSPAVISIIYWKNVCSILEINAYERTIYSIVNTWFKKKKKFNRFLFAHTLYPLWMFLALLVPWNTYACTIVTGDFISSWNCHFSLSSFVLLSLKTKKKVNLCLSSCFNQLFCKFLSVYFLCMEWSKNMQMLWPSSRFFKLVGLSLMWPLLYLIRACTDGARCYHTSQDPQGIWTDRTIERKHN